MRLKYKDDAGDDNFDHKDEDDDDEVACHAGHLGLQRPHTIGPHGEPPGIAAGDGNHDDHDYDDDRHHHGDQDHDHDEHADNGDDDDDNTDKEKLTTLPWSVAAGGRDANPNHFL